MYQNQKYLGFSSASLIANQYAQKYADDVKSVTFWMMFTITYQTPYNNQEWRTQSFSTLEEANRMIEFYRSCGSPARLIKWKTTESK
jgi:hypothetical protein